MVVLDGHNMMGTGPNQYLQPDYLSPLPTTLDAKKSPLALLAQTCTRIGNDSPNTKSLLPTLDGSKRKGSTSSESGSVNLTTSDTPQNNSTSKNGEKDRERDSVSRPRSSNGTSGGSNSKSGTGKSSPAFKPYESSPLINSTKSFGRDDLSRKSPLESPLQMSIQEKAKVPSKRPASSSPNQDVPSGSSAKQPRKSPNSGGDKKASSISGTSDDGKSSPRSNHNEQGSSPIIRSGMEVLQGHGLGKDFKSNASALSSLSALAAHYPPGFDPTNPAMRPPFFAPPTHPFLGGGYPPSAMPSNGMPPYVSYTRVKTPSGAETIVPVCKDPYCTGCSLSMPGLMANAAAMAAAAGFPGFLSPPGSGGICPAGCVQCDHQKFSIGLPSFMAPPGLTLQTSPSSTGYPSSLLSQHAHAAAAAAQQQQQQQQQQHSQRPYVCNWIVGESYCGKRFPSSEELLQHLRTHTNMSTSEASTLASMTSPASLYSNALLSSSMNAAAAAAAAAMHRNYPTPPLSPLSAARYNPYAAASLAAAGKGGNGFGVPTSLSSLVPHPQSLANYYSTMSPYAMYGQRIGPPVHP